MEEKNSAPRRRGKTIPAIRDINECAFRNGHAEGGRENQGEKKRESRVARGSIALTTVCTRARSFTHAAPHESLPSRLIIAVDE